MQFACFFGVRNQVCSITERHRAGESATANGSCFSSDGDRVGPLRSRCTSLVMVASSLSAYKNGDQLHSIERGSAAAAIALFLAQLPRRDLEVASLTIISTRTCDTAGSRERTGPARLRYLLRSPPCCSPLSWPFSWAAIVPERVPCLVVLCPGLAPLVAAVDAGPPVAGFAAAGAGLLAPAPVACLAVPFTALSLSFRRSTRSWRLGPWWRAPPFLLLAVGRAGFSRTFCADRY